MEKYDGPSRLKGNIPSRVVGKTKEDRRQKEYDDYNAARERGDEGSKDIEPIRPADLSADNIVGRKLIQRDSGKTFVVTDILENTVGTTKLGEMLVHLEREGGGLKGTKSLKQLIDQLQTPGSPWRLKE